MVARGPGRRVRRRRAALIVVPDVLDAHGRLGVAARARTNGPDRRGDRLGRQDRHQGSAAHGAGTPGPTHASAASYNNHWGVPLTLARMPRTARFGVFEIGMNHAGEITPLTSMVRPHVAADHHGRAGASRKLRQRRGHRRRQGRDLRAGSSRRQRPCSTATTRITSGCWAHAKASRAGRIVTFGEHPKAPTSRLTRLDPEARHVASSRRRSTACRSTYRLGSPGRHLAHEQPRRACRRRGARRAT